MTFDSAAASATMEVDPVDEALKYIRSPESKASYRRMMGYFLEWAQISGAEFIQKASSDPRGTKDLLVRYIESMTSRKVSGAYILTNLSSLKCLLEENDVTTINWRKIKRAAPRGARFGKDRAPTLEEIRKVLSFCSPRERMIVLMMASGGFRVGAWAYFHVGDFSLVKESPHGDIGRVVIYRGQPEEYVTFVTPEAVAAIQEYLALRERGGEKLGPDSLLVRDLWDMTTGAQRPSSVSSEAIQSILFRLMSKAGLHNKGFKQAHGFRKFFKTRAEKGTKSIYVEILMGHSLGVSDSYMKATEGELLAEYLKAVPYLTVTEAEELKTKLSTKDDELSSLRTEFNIMKQRVTEYIKMVESELAKSKPTG